MDLKAWNFVTEDFDVIEWESEENVIQHLPQNENVQGLYQCWRGLGCSIIHAYVNALEMSVGNKPPFDVREQAD